jgi:cobalt-zinc-cadmium efflux system protein
MHHAPDGCAADGSSSRRLAQALALASLYMVAEAVGGLWTGSLALLADASHMLSDVLALCLALAAIAVARRAAAPHPHGLHRLELVAVFVQGALLVGVALLIVLEAVERLGSRPSVMGAPMLAIASGGLLVNAVSLALLHGDRDSSLNLRGAWLHVVSDAVGSVGAMLAGALVWAFGWSWADPLASVVIALLVGRSAILLLRDAGREWTAAPARARATPAQSPPPRA